MKQPESQPDDFVDAADARLAELIEAAPLPATPPSLEQATRRRIRHRITQQLVLRTAAAAACVAALLVVMQFIGNVPRPGQQPTDGAAVPLNDSELASLFAPPPVDPLSVLDRRQQVSYQTLNQLERSQ